MDQTINRYLTDELEVRKLLEDILSEENINWVVFTPLTHIPIKGWQAFLMTGGTPVRMMYDILIDLDDTPETIKARIRHDLSVLKTQFQDKDDSATQD